MHTARVIVAASPLSPGAHDLHPPAGGGHRPVRTGAAADVTLSCRDSVTDSR
jgi:hypothetical protein